MQNYNYNTFVVVVIAKRIIRLLYVYHLYTSPFYILNVNINKKMYISHIKNYRYCIYEIYNNKYEKIFSILVSSTRSI